MKLVELIYPDSVDKEALSTIEKILEDDIRKKMDANFSKEMAGANDLILPDEEVTFTEINTEEAESFFDM